MTPSWPSASPPIAAPSTSAADSTRSPAHPPGGSPPSTSKAASWWPASTPRRPTARSRRSPSSATPSTSAATSKASAESPGPRLAALDATTGALRDGFVPPENEGGYYQGQTGSESHSGDNNGAVHNIGVTSDGRYVVVGGDFLEFGGQGGLLVLDGATGAPAAWQPEMDRPVFGVAMWPGDNRTFFAATGGSGGTLQAFRIEDGAPVPVDDDSDSDSGRRNRNRNSSSSVGEPQGRAAVGTPHRRRLHRCGGHHRAGVSRRPLRLRAR